MPIPRFYTLKEAAKAFGTTGISVKSLRREVHAGRLKAIRARSGRNSKILLQEEEILRWLNEDAGQRHYALSAA